MKRSGGVEKADVCLILEGTYPYVTGGVSAWTHDLLIAQKDLTFHLVTLLPRNANLTLRYELPRNVLSLSKIFIQETPTGSRPTKQSDLLIASLEEPLTMLQAGGGFQDLIELIERIESMRPQLGSHILLNSPAAWNLLIRMYNRDLSHASFLDYFWSWRALLGGLYSVVLADIPPAAVYHTVSTGYAGLFAARATFETGRPCILTEHGIYTNERRIEMAMADWLHDAVKGDLRIDSRRRSLKSLWVDTFVAYSHACYEAASEIITLYKGNHEFQLRDGAPQGKLRVIPNGIDIDRFAHINRTRDTTRPTVGLIGRVVPIKDVKTFIRSVALLRATIPDIEALILGPTEEDEDYYAECVQLVCHFGLQDAVRFTGRVKLEEHLGRLDLVVLTSLSEAQPLVILEAGAARIPVIATDVGACHEMILGPAGEKPALGAGGAVTPLCNPSATAQEIARLLTDHDGYAQCSSALRRRVELFYEKRTLDRTYQQIYQNYGSVETQWRESALNSAN